MTLWLATKNAHKIREIKEFFGRFPEVGRIKSPEDLPGGLKSYKPPEETGDSFIENAEIKARYLYSLLEKTGAETGFAPENLPGDSSEEEIEQPPPEEMRRQVWIIGEDSGLEAKALKGGPGVRSARYSGPGATDDKNTLLLLKNLKGAADRTARYVCNIYCAAFPDYVSYMFFHECRGSIAHKKRGKNGFGYDSVFMPEGLLGTFGELPERIKNRISHRAQALDELSMALFLSEPPED